MTMREGWANVYPCTRGGVTLGTCKPRREDVETRRLVENVFGPRPIRVQPLYRVHAKLKPEGAPKRYAGPGERLAWEREPFEAARARSLGMVLVYVEL